MQFTRLRLNGFKSFVDPTDLVIAEGLTGVVGPNGCGKSNLLEALRWVMGENRPTAMRGGGMEDVIFAGAATRPARNFAEVSLSVDNSERRAPPGFNDSEILDVVRRITRDAGSAYKCNAREVRARDVQMLFADASTGSHSPALVRQGQISELINAKPTSRRRVLEEAAGISGLYQRRHEAELKLRATEANLERVQDTVEQLSGQLAQLARQAKQAARYRAIGAELRTAEWMLLYRRWREASDALEAARAALREAATEASRAEGANRTAVAAREEAEENLPPLREEQSVAAAVLQRLMVERDGLAEAETRARGRIAALKDRQAQLSRDREREAGLTGDAAKTLDKLTEEASRLDAAQAGQEATEAEAADAAEEAADVLSAREADHAALTESVADLAARHQAVERLLSDNRKSESRSAAEEDKARAAATEARQAAEDGTRRFAEAEALQESAGAELDAAEAAAEEARTRLSDLQTREATARAARSEAEGEVKALRAEAQAVRRLLERDGAGGAQLLDEVRVDEGLEAALGAALGDDLKSPRCAAGGPTGWADLPAYDAPPPMPEGLAPLAAHVEGPGLLQRRLSQIALADPEAAERLQPGLLPGQALVSKQGDVWRWDGFRSAAADAPSAAARHLEQRNRLSDLEAALSAAEARLEAAEADHFALSEDLGAASDAEKAARAAVRAADSKVAEASRAHSRAEADRTLAAGKAENFEMAALRHADAAAEARRQVAEAERQAAALEDLSEARARLADLKTAVEAARITMMSRKSAHDEVKRAGEGRARRLAAIAKERQTWDERLATADARIADLDRRAQETGAELAAAEGEPEELARKRADLAGAIDAAERRKTAAIDAVAAADAALRQAAATEREAVARAGEAREARARAETRLEAGEEAAEATAERIAEDTEHSPDTLLAALDTDPETMPDAGQIEVDIVRLRRSRDALGAVNLRAEEDAADVQAEHDQLSAEREDLGAATARLRDGIAGLNREGRERLLTAFEQVNDNFGTLFTHLFGGGEARLALVESDDPLEAGLEILCQPPGKKLSTLSLLSGGEQTLTALALIFAVFLANPAPICVLDEVDAPLDDANVTRFCDLLDEMTRRTQTRFLIITHHAVTMSRMDRLFGVTMAEQGVSQLVSVDLKHAETLVA